MSPHRSRTHSRLTAAAVGALAVFALVACGDDGDDDPGGADTTTAEETTTSGATGGGDQDCRFVSTGAVQEVFGEAMELLAGGESCAFRDGALTLQFSHIDILIDPEQYAEEALDSCDDGTVVEVDAGDRAYACLSFVGPLANLYQGDELVVINTSGGDDDEATRDSLAELLPDVTTG